MQIRMLTLLMVLTGATVAAAEDMRMPVTLHS